MPSDNQKPCDWGRVSEITRRYHDEEWGMPVRDDLRRRGFKYLGPVTVYSHLQACGIVNDHLETCPRYAVVNAATEAVRKRRFRESGIVDFARRAGKDART